MFQESPRDPTREGVLRAAAKVAEVLPPTPLLPVEIRGIRCWVKAENLQPIGAFKIRGAWNRLSELTAEERGRGVVGVSSGNHAQGVAWAARKLGISARIVMPHDAPQMKLDATRSMGADIVIYQRPGEDRDAISQALCAETGAVLVHAYADPWVIEGQGSAGIEIAEQMGREPSRIIVCCGGGGLSAGLALACPNAALVPVEPEGWDDVARSLIAGEILSVAPDAPPTECDALQTPRTAPVNFAVLKRRASPGVVVTPEKVRAAQRFAFAKLKLVLEPGGAAALAAALMDDVEIDIDTVIMLTGGNVDPAKFAAVISSTD